MNRVAVITDIHGNLPALEASLRAIDAIGVDGLYCGGDLVGYGPHPNEVCRLIEDREIPTIYGNYDYAIGRELDDCGCAYVTPHDRELGQQSVAWTLAHTDQRSKDFMRGLPFDLHFELGERKVHLVHGSPRKVNEYLFEDKPASLYERLARAETDDVLVFGHTHKPWISRVRRGAVRQLRVGRQAEGWRPASSVRDPRARRERSGEGVDRAGPLRRRGGRARSRRRWLARRVRHEAGCSRVTRERREAEKMKYVLFVCTHNAGRSQMAQALFERTCPSDCRAESAGSDPARQVWPEVVEVMREIGVDLSGNKPKRLSVEMQLHADWAVTMGCGDVCPYVPTRVDDWDIPDPAGRSIDEVREIRDMIDDRIQRARRAEESTRSGSTRPPTAGGSRNSCPR